LGRPAPKLLGYEVWSPLPAHDHVQDVGPAMTRKLRAIRCYPSQLAAFAYDRPWRAEPIRGVMAARGRYAEVFQELDVRGG
jgi:LmbE family N-acetylglucosaminyl deacetylase